MQAYRTPVASIRVQQYEWCTYENEALAQHFYKQCQEKGVIVLPAENQGIIRRSNGKTYRKIWLAGEGHAIENMNECALVSYSDHVVGRSPYTRKFFEDRVVTKPAMPTVSQGINGCVVIEDNSAFLVFNENVNAIVPCSMQLMQSQECACLLFYKFRYSTSTFLYLQNNHEFVALEWGHEFLIGITTEFYKPDKSKFSIVPDCVLDKCMVEDLAPCSTLGDVKRCLVVESPHHTESQQKTMFLFTHHAL